MEEEKKKEKTIYDLGLHETLIVVEKLSQLINGQQVEKKYEVTRVSGGWIYAFEFIGFRQSPIVFVPFNKEFIEKKIKEAK